MAKSSIFEVISVVVHLVCPSFTENHSHSCGTAGNNRKVQFPKVIGLVEYDSGKKPIGCMTPRYYPDAQAFGILTFENAETILNNKNNEDEDTDEGYPVADHTERNDYTPVKHYRRNYMAGILRLYQAGHLHHQYHEPGMYYWSNLRRNNSNTIQDILLAITAALGYEDDEKREFTIKNQWNEPQTVNVNLSIQAFCVAMLEMIPFSRTALENAVSKG